MIYSGTGILKQFNFTFMNWVYIQSILLKQSWILPLYISVTISSLIQGSDTQFKRIIKKKKGPGIVKCARRICTWCNSNEVLEITEAKHLVIAATLFFPLLLLILQKRQLLIHLISLANKFFASKRNHHCQIEMKREGRRRKKLFQSEWMEFLPLGVMKRNMT